MPKAGTKRNTSRNAWKDTLHTFLRKVGDIRWVKYVSMLSLHFASVCRKLRSAWTDTFSEKFTEGDGVCECIHQRENESQELV